MNRWSTHGFCLALTRKDRNVVNRRTEMCSPASKAARNTSREYDPHTQGPKRRFKVRAPTLKKLIQYLVTAQTSHARTET